jgi:hypothetical protein
MRLALAFAALLAPLAFAAAPPVAPTIPEGFVARPAIVTAEGKRYESGTAFFVDIGGQRFAMTAHSLFGPAGGLPAQLTPAELPTKIKEVKLSEAWTKAALSPAAAPLTLPGVRPMEKDASGDFAMMLLPAGLVSGNVAPTAGRPLAAANAKVGDTVWVAAPLLDGPELSLHAHQATVVQVDKSWLIYEYKEPGLNLVATTGAPVLDKDGNVVGLNLGGGQDQGKLYGSAAPVDAFRATVTAALPPPIPK